MAGLLNWSITHSGPKLLLLLLVMRLFPTPHHIRPTHTNTHTHTNARARVFRTGLTFRDGAKLKLQTLHSPLKPAGFNTVQEIWHTQDCPWGWKLWLCSTVNTDRIHAAVGSTCEHTLLIIVLSSRLVHSGTHRRRQDWDCYWRWVPCPWQREWCKWPKRRFLIKLYRNHTAQI